MNSYRFHASQDIFAMLSPDQLPSLTTEVIAQQLGGAAVRALATDGAGGYDVELQYGAPSHEEAVQSLATALANLGFEVTEVLVTEWVDRAVEGLIVGLLGGGALGATSRNSGVTAAASTAGAIAGRYVGAQMQVVRRQFVAKRRVYPAGWKVTPVETAPGSGPIP